MDAMMAEPDADVDSLAPVDPDLVRSIDTPLLSPHWYLSVAWRL